VLIVHGTADQHVPYNGGTGAKARDERVDKPVSHAFSVWRAANGCATASRASRKGTISRQTATGCRDGVDVSLITVHDGGHAWPGGVPPRRDWADVPTNAISASEEIWRFFAAHPKR
jgi:polyhydroxybutyrate depolymerase